MDKQHILNEIKRTAAANGGVPLGTARFFQDTGIKVSDWKGRYWVRWSDALKEAGLGPNRFGTAPYDRAFLIEKFIGLARELGHLPSRWELKLKKRGEPAFPADTVFQRSLGNRPQIVAGIREYCASHGGYDDILALCKAIPALPPERSDSLPKPTLEEVGSVYLVKSGRHYKIGSSNSAGRREYELAIQLPDKASLVHEIRTDDPTGIEAYWHRRFAAKRKGGEWFELRADDVRAFRRRKFM